jgi:hypothetical protein
MTKTIESLEDEIERSRKLISTLNDNCRDYRLRLDLREKELDRAKTKADHFDILMAAVKENEVVRGAWERFMMTLRLAGYDGTK